MFRGKIRQINAYNRTIPCIEFGMNIENDEGYNIKILGYSMKLSFAGVPVGDISEFPDIDVPNRSYSLITQEISINPHVFEAIEKARKSGDVSVNSEIRILYRNTSVKESDSIVGYIPCDQYKLSQSDWIRLASDMGYTKYKIFEMLYPDIPQLPEFENGIRDLEEAQTLFFEGKNDLAVSKCRSVFEHLNERLAEFPTSPKKHKMDSKIAEVVDAGPHPPAKLTSNNAIEDNLKSQKIENIRFTLWRLLHIGPHCGYSVTREDAELVLMLCFSMVRYYSVQLNELANEAK